MKGIAFILLIFSMPLWAVKGQYVEGHDLTSTCKLTFYVKQDNKILTGTCSASFIGNKTFVTAEHCYEDVSQNLQMVRSQEMNQGSFFTCPGSEKKYTASNLFPMKNSGLSELQDIAIIKVEEEVSVGPIKIPKSAEELETLLSDKQNCYISGYGLDNENKYGVLKTARITNIENKPLDIFSSGSRYRVRLRENYADHGDSGGPLYCEGKDGAVLIGVVHGGMKGAIFSDIEKLSVGLDWLNFHKNYDVKDEELFRKVVSTTDMCESLTRCSETLKKINELTADTDKVISVLLKQTGEIRAQIDYGGELNSVTLNDLWEEMIREWEKNNCFKKLYP